MPLWLYSLTHSLGHTRNRKWIGSFAWNSTSAAVAHLNVSGAYEAPARYVYHLTFVSVGSWKLAVSVGHGALVDLVSVTSFDGTPPIGVFFGGEGEEPAVSVDRVE